MKLRILGNKLRYRLSQTEVSELESGQSVTKSVVFPAGNSFQYSVVNSKSISQPEIVFENQVIQLSIPSFELQGWTEDSREGIYHKWDNDSFEIALEKDFQCLHKRPGEDETDNYPNPRENH
ncbi:MAG: hypothetical protein NXI20_12800 [bacterium]|nr:hypothetical protein [bacterium]